MPHSLRNVRALALALGALCSGLLPGLGASLRDGGIDPANLGKGDWIYFLSAATNRLGGNVPGVVNVPTLMDYYKSQGMRYFVIKVGTGSTNFNGSGASWQFSSNLVALAHAAGLWVFPYTRSYGDDVPGEINMAAACFALGADGWVIDAEAEWESSRLGTNGPTLATQYGNSLRALFPNKFIAHAPFPIISFHPSFPYREFGLFCDTVMPQAYWKTIYGTNQNAVGIMFTNMNNEFRNWQGTLAGNWTNAIKPLAPIAQGYSPATNEITSGAEIDEFFNRLRTNPNPASVTGYKGVSFWRADLHTPEMWAAIGTNSIGALTATPPSVLFAVSALPGSQAALVTWQSTNAASSQVAFGLTTNLDQLTAEDPVPRTHHSVLLTGLTPDTNYFYAVLSRAGTNAWRSDGWSFATAGELILDNTNATFTGSWSAGSTSMDKFGTDYRFVIVNAGGSTASALFTPLIVTRGRYDVFVWHPQGANRPTNASVTVYFTGGSVTTIVNQTLNGGRWLQVGTNLPVSAGTNAFVRISNLSSDTGKIVMADAVRFVYRSEQDTPAGPTVPDWWAWHYFGASINPLADSDSDGHANWMEYLAGTDPTSAASRLSFSLAPSLDGTLRAGFAPLNGGRAYQLQQRVEPSGWLTLTNLPAHAGTLGQGWFTVTNEMETTRVLRLKVDWAQ